MDDALFRNEHGFWIVIGVIAVASIFFHYRASVSRDRTIQMLAEKGQPIPPELTRGDYRKHRHSARSGIILMCIGIAIAVFFWAMTQPGAPIEISGGNAGNNWLPVVGIFPFMISVGILLGSAFGRSDRQKD